jgi:hypothetical protein
LLYQAFGSVQASELSNTVWAYATAGINHPKLFQKVANHIAGLDNLDQFIPQGIHYGHMQQLASITLDYSRKLQITSLGLEILIFSHPQELSITVWAYATAGINHTVESDNLDRFKPQALKDTVWAYATAQVSHPKLFHKVANASIKHRAEFNNTQHVANLLWAYATMGIINKQLFLSFVPTSAKLIDSYNNQGLANIA